MKSKIKMLIFMLLLIISPHIHLVNGQFELHDTGNSQGQGQGQGQESQASPGSGSKPGADKPPEDSGGGDKPQKEAEGGPPPRTDEFDDYLGDYEDPPGSDDAKKDKNLIVESTEYSNESNSGGGGGSRSGKKENEDEIPENSSNLLNYSFNFILLSLSTIFMIKINSF